MQYWRRLAIVIIGFVESLLFSGCLFGWPSLVYVLQQEGVYSHLCQNVNDSNPDITTTTTTSFELSTAWLLSTTTTEIPRIFKEDLKNLETFVSTSNSGDYTSTSLIQTNTGFETTTSNNNLIIQKEENNGNSKEDLNSIRKRRSSSINDNNDDNALLPRTPRVEATKTENTLEKVMEKKHRKPCKEQTVHMSLIYTVAAVSYGLTSILIGFSLDIFGLWFTRIGGCIMTSGGFFFLTFTSKNSPWLLWPALILVALGSSQLRLSSFQFANLWPKYRTTVLILYSSAYSVSTTLFLVFQIAYVGHIPYKIVGFILAIISLCTFPPTLIMPRMKIPIHVVQEDTIEIKQKYDKNSTEAVQPDSDDDNVPRIFRNRNDNDSKYLNPFDEPESRDANKKNPKEDKKSKDNVEVPPLSTSLWTLSALLHVFWQFITFFLVLFYSATFIPWIQMMTDDHKIIEHYNKIIAVCALIAPIFIPIAGLVTDWQIRKAAQNEDREERLALTMQAPAFTIAIASLFVLCTMICKVFFSPGAIYTSMILIAVARPFIVGSCASYIQIRFHPSHFNRLNGIFTTIVSIMSLVQFPIIVWMKQSSDDFVKAQLMLIGLMLISFASPVHMMIKPLSRKYARAQLKFRTDI